MSTLLEQAILLAGENPRPRLTKLYGDFHRSMRTNGSHAVQSGLMSMLMPMLWERNEISPEDEAQLRKAFLPEVTE